MSKPQHTVTIVVTDLQADQGGWSANGCWLRRYTATAPTYRGAWRKALAQHGLVGWRRDGWAGQDSWRMGCIGAYVDEA